VPRRIDNPPDAMRVEPGVEPFDRHRQIGKLKKTGRADLLIGCIVLAHRATLVTRNFDHGLKIENWVD
jgi:predicted nucleic acid-binding protein